jgi:CsoR family transcriptional regulator, copper-sensing transcriptional repressor
MKKYCLDILIQSSAIKNAISSIEREVLKNHLKTHVIEQIKNNKEKKTVEELIKIYKLKNDSRINTDFKRIKTD